MAMSFCREREGGACASRVKFYRISSSPEPPARIVPDTIESDHNGGPTPSNPAHMQPAEGELCPCGSSFRGVGADHGARTHSCPHLWESARSAATPSRTSAPGVSASLAALSAADARALWAWSVT